jgi:mono/diheme cytochrome c family protein
MIYAFLEMYRQRVIFAFVVIRLIVVVWVATVGVAQAQELGGAQQGLRLARAQCSECHLVDKVAGRSSNAAAPSFERIANVPGMTSAALTAALRTSHETMPNVVIKGNDIGDLVAYILSLKDGD